MTLLNEADQVYIGTLAADAVYMGADLVWSSIPPPFAPTDIAGLAIWVDASQLGLADGAAVTSWPNLGTGADPTPHLSPAPIFRAAALNGLPVVRHSVDRGCWRWTGTGVNADFTLIYVGRMWGTSFGRFVTAAYPSGGNLLFGYWTTYMDVAYVSGGAGFFVPDTRITTTTAWRLYSADGSTTGTYTPRLFIDGSFAGQHPSPPAMHDWGGTLNISGYGTSTEETCDCELAELLLYDHKLSDGERVQAEDYLRAKWGLP